MFAYKNLIFSLRGELAFFIKLYEAVLSLYYRSDILVIALILFNYPFKKLTHFYGA